MLEESIHPKSLGAPLSDTKTKREPLTLGKARVVYSHFHISAAVKQYKQIRILSTITDLSFNMTLSLATPDTRLVLYM